MQITNETYVRSRKKKQFFELKRFLNSQLFPNYNNKEVIDFLINRSKVPLEFVLNVSLDSIRVNNGNKSSIPND